MGVDRTDYIMFGWMTQYIDNAYENPTLLPYLEGHENVKFALVVDGMSGKYSAFGKVISARGEYDECSTVTTSLEAIQGDTGDLLLDYVKVFNKLPETSPILLIFSHYR